MDNIEKQWQKYIHKRGHHGEQIIAMRKDARVKKWEKKKKWRGEEMMNGWKDKSQNGSNDHMIKKEMRW